MRVFILKRLIRFLVTFAVFQVALFGLAYVLSGGLAEARQAAQAPAAPAAQSTQTTEEQLGAAVTEGPAAASAPAPTLAPTPADPESEFGGELEGVTRGQLEAFGEEIPETRPKPTARPAPTQAAAEAAAPAEAAATSPAAEPAPIVVIETPPDAGPAARAWQWLIEPTQALLESRAPRTVLLFLPATLLGFGLGQALGKRIAWRRGGALELGVSLTGVALYTSFAPFLAFLLINLFALKLNWLPVENLITTSLWAHAGTPPTNGVVGWLLLTLAVDGALMAGLWWATRRVNDLHPAPLPFLPPDVYNARAVRAVTTSQGVVRLLGAIFILALDLIAWRLSGWGAYGLDMVRHLALPLLTLTLLSFGETMLLMRTTMLETLGADHVPTAYAKGLPDGVVRDQHVARLAVMPVVARFVLQLPFVLVGSLVIEPVFAYDGIGQALFDAAGNQNLPVVIGILSVVGMLALLAHPIVDILHAWLDPRVRDAAIRPTPGV